MTVFLGAVLAAPIAAKAETGVAAPYIVVFRENAVSPIGSTRIDAARVTAAATDLAGRLRFSPDNVYTTALGGFSARLTPAQLAAVRSDARVASVSDDAHVSLAEDPLVTEYQVSLGAPKVPAGVRRIGADHNDIANINGRDGRVDEDVAVIDTGIDGKNPDLNVVGGYNCTSSNRGAWADGYGHGTHVAGTIGALDNDSGVVGVAPGVRLWAVKVLDSQGDGLLSWIVCGIDWVTRQRSADGTRPRIEVANMSLRLNLPSGGDDNNCGHTIRDAMHTAICRSVAAGTVYVVAAGNERSDASAYRPATYSEAITVSAMTDYDGKPGGDGTRPKECGAGYPDDTWAGFSNFGADVDLTAPGICVLSTWAGGQYAYASGTSMAAPHVAGAAALYLAQYPGARPQQVRMALQYAGRLDWRKWTDPDGKPDTMVWVADFARPPDFDVSADASTTYAAADSTVAVGVNIERSHGHTAPVRLTVDGLPPGLTAEVVSTTRTEATLGVHVASWAASGRYSATVVGDDGELTRKAGFDVFVDTDAPTAHFTAPDGAARMQQTTSAHISWNQSDNGGSGIAGLTLWRQRSAPSAPGECAATDYVNVGYPRTVKGDYTDSLYNGYCYRWSLSLRDEAGNRTTLISGTVLVDTSAPSKPSASVVASSSTVDDPRGVDLPSAYVDGEGTVWLRGGGSGSLDLLVSALDPQSGIASMSLTAGTTTSGWTLPKSPLKGSPATAHLAYAAKAVALSLTIRATNGAGERGNSIGLRFAPDGKAPSPAAWTRPAGSLAYSRDGEVRLAWSGGSDGGSGLAARQFVRRERAAVTSTGACGSFSADGTPKLVPNGYVETGLRSGYCYRWKLRTTDHVGNLAAAVVSGKVLVDTVAPRISIDKPVTGATIVKSTTAQTVSWSASDGGGSKIASVKVQRQRSGVHSAGSCAGASWKNDGSAVAATSPMKVVDLDPGSCYRWIITAADHATNSTSAITGYVLISGGATSSVSGGSAPSVGAVSVVPAAMPLTSTGMAWLDARWTASGGAATLTGYELRLSSSGGTSWDTFTTPNGATPLMTLRLPAGRTYLVEVRARNSLGLWSGWSDPRSFAVGLAQAESSSAFEKVGAWKSVLLAGASGGAVSSSTASGAIIRYSFTGRSVALVATTAPNRGTADVYVDGWRVATIDLYTPVLTTRQVVFTRNWTSSGSHVVSMQIHTTSDRPRVDLDAAVVLN